MQKNAICTNYRIRTSLSDDAEESVKNLEVSIKNVIDLVKKDQALSDNVQNLENNLVRPRVWVRCVGVCVRTH